MVHVLSCLSPLISHLVDGQVAPLKWGDAQALEQLVALGVDHDQTAQLF